MDSLLVIAANSNASILWMARIVVCDNSIVMILDRGEAWFLMMVTIFAACICCVMIWAIKKDK